MTKDEVRTLVIRYGITCNENKDLVVNLNGEDQYSEKVKIDMALIRINKAFILDYLLHRGCFESDTKPDNVY
jgi:hypothetical protein